MFVQVITWLNINKWVPSGGHRYLKKYYRAKYELILFTYTVFNCIDYIYNVCCYIIRMVAVCVKECPNQSIFWTWNPGQHICPSRYLIIQQARNQSVYQPTIHLIQQPARPTIQLNQQPARPTICTVQWSTCSSTNNLLDQPSCSMINLLG